MIVWTFDTSGGSPATVMWAKARERCTTTPAHPRADDPYGPVTCTGPSSRTPGKRYTAAALSWLNAAERG